MTRRRALLGSASLGVLAAAIVVLLRTGQPRETDHMERGGRIRLAVLGDSDSHGYRDHVLGTRRGGVHHATTLQWTDVLVRTRGQYFDPGEEGVWGSRAFIARARAALGREAKAPRKADYRWNYAVSGARCSTLVSERPWQTRWLISALRAERAAWADGIVVIRIGVNDVGLSRHMDRYAKQGVDADHRARVARCADEIAAAARAIRAAHPSVRIVVVGVADDSSWPVGIVPDRDATQVARIRDALDLFDDAVRSAIRSVEGAAFMRDRSWYQDNWPDRDAEGRAVLGARSLGGTVAVTNTRGDEPHHLSLADGHAGTVANGFWARELILFLDQTYGLRVPPLSDAEIAALADPDGAYGIAPPGPR